MRQVTCEVPGTFGVTFISLPGDKVSPDQYRAAQALERHSFRESLTRSQEEIDYLVNWDDPDDFVLSRVNPMHAVLSGRLHPDQSFSKPIATFAYEGDDLVGYAYSANNVSGNFTQQALKRLRSHKNYVWFREIAVHPDLRRKGIARTLGFLSLQERKTKQPVAAYAWEETPGIIRRLAALGFVSTDVSKPHSFGPDKAPVVQHRMQASGNVLVSRLASIGTLLPKKVRQTAKEA